MSDRSLHARLLVDDRDQGQPAQPGQAEVRREAVLIRDCHLFCGLKSLMSSLGSPVFALNQPVLQNNRKVPQRLCICLGLQSKFDWLAAISASAACSGLKISENSLFLETGFAQLHLPPPSPAKPATDSSLAEKPFLPRFLARRVLQFPVSARRHRLYVPFCAPVSGVENPVPNSTRLLLDGEGLPDEAPPMLRVHARKARADRRNVGRFPSCLAADPTDCSEDPGPATISGNRQS
jgi:hypothetical protein